MLSYESMRTMLFLLLDMPMERQNQYTLQVQRGLEAVAGINMALPWEFRLAAKVATEVIQHEPASSCFILVHG